MAAKTIASEHIVVRKRGGPENLELDTRQVPAPGRGEVRVRMLAAGVAFADLMVREGIYPEKIDWPRTPGYDIVGEIEAVGSDVPDTLRVGGRVAALTVHGSYARHRNLPVQWCVPVPETVDPAQAVALVLNYTTAYQMMHRVANLQSGETVLIHAAAGGVGTAVLELAAISGIRVIGLCSKPKHDLVRKLGGEPIDYRDEDIEARVRELTGGQGVEAVLDAIGGAESRRALRLIKRTGIVVCYGALAVANGGRLSIPGAAKTMLGVARLSSMKALNDVTGLRGYNIASWRDERPALYRQDLAQLVAWLSEGKLNPVIDQTLPLAQAAQAQTLLGEGRSSGKLVLV